VFRAYVAKSLVLASVAKPQRNGKIKASCVTYIWRALSGVMSKYNNILSGGKESPLLMYICLTESCHFIPFFTATEKEIQSTKNVFMTNNDSVFT
jgi:hypothetical protein